MRAQAGQVNGYRYIAGCNIIITRRLRVRWHSSQLLQWTQFVSRPETRPGTKGDCAARIPPLNETRVKLNNTSESEPVNRSWGGGVEGEGTGSEQRNRGRGCLALRGAETLKSNEVLYSLLTTL
ncbi:hypothetical protein J6590_013060 [Homalodisca vitripennis]|nr:hypothetical protein J6590_013060 [Homalodisca vitripennis]